MAHSALVDVLDTGDELEVEFAGLLNSAVCGESLSRDPVWSSWLENDVYEMIDMRKTKVKNYVTGRWVLTVKRDKDGSFQKTKARWVLRGFQDRQKDSQQTDSPTTTRPGFRLACQMIANNQWDFHHIDLKTGFYKGKKILDI